ncbi:hypothetical protein D9M68_820050 [compost metagenome]
MRKIGVAVDLDASPVEIGERWRAVVGNDLAQVRQTAVKQICCSGRVRAENAAEAQQFIARAGAAGIGRDGRLVEVVAALGFGART